jgi:hypothetical protein
MLRFATSMHRYENFIRVSNEPPLVAKVTLKIAWSARASLRHILFTLHSHRDRSSHEWRLFFTDNVGYLTDGAERFRYMPSCHASDFFTAFPAKMAVWITLLEFCLLLAQKSLDAIATIFGANHRWCNLHSRAESMRRL